MKILTSDRLLSRAIACAVLGCAAFAADASSFSVAPIRVELDKSHRTGVLTLHNDSDTSVVVQVTTVAWTQDADGGDDHYEETRDVLATPPVFEVAAHGEQIVRVALRRDADSTTELPYRVYFEEVPQARTTTFNGLNVALRIGLPVFVAPVAAAQPDVQWTAAWAADGTLKVEAENRGHAHLQVAEFDVDFDGAKAHVGGSRYLLPGTRTHWNVTAPAGASHTGNPHLKGAGDHGEFSAELVPTSN